MTPPVATPAITVPVVTVPVIAGPMVSVDSPIIFNATDSARAGDVVSIQGSNFGSAAQAYLSDANGNSLQALKIVNRVGTTWLATEIPSTASGALLVRVTNGGLTSAAVKLNAAVPHHIDGTQIAPDATFRLFGRNLMLSGANPVVTVDGVPATVNTGASDDTMLVVTAPTALQSTVKATITVDNGNGSGSAVLDRTVAVQTGQSGDPFDLNVGWAAGFSAFSGRGVDAANDSRLSSKAVCNGSQNDAPAIQAAVDYAASHSGGVVQLPSGTCRIAGSIAMRSNTVLQGMGKDLTTLRYEGNYPIFAMNVDLTGVRNLSLVNAGSVTEGPLLKNSTRLFMQNVRVDLKTSKQMFLTDNTNMVVSGSEFLQGGSIAENGPYIFLGTGGLVFTNNKTTWVAGANSFERTHDSYMAGNTFTRDGSYQAAAGTLHAFTMDFAHRIAVVGNTFNVKNGPITNTTRNDGETLLTEGGGNRRTENLGTLTSATADSFTDTSNSLNVNPFETGTIPENYGVAIVSGKGAGQTRRIVSYANGKAVVDRAWQVTPDAGSHYSTFVWGLEKSMLKGNSLSQNPRGIWLYQTALRDVAVIGNNISEGGGIYLRAYQNLANKMFTPMYNVRVSGNTIENTTRNWGSHVTAVFINADSKAFGTAMTGIDIRDNRVVANLPNVSSQWEEYAGTEGFINMTRFEGNGSYEAGTWPRILGTVFQRNTCANCEVGFRIGTGATGLVLTGNSLINTRTFIDDWATSTTREVSAGTVSQ